MMASSIWKNRVAWLRRAATASGLLLALAGVPRSVAADRLILAPTGSIVHPGDLKAEHLFGADGGYVGWLNVGLPMQDMGVEVQAEWSRLGRETRETFGAQYSVISEGFTNDLAPSISVGVRDLPNRGPDGRAFFLALTKTFGLSVTQERVLRNWKLSLGVGSHRMGGLYAGIQGKFRPGFAAQAEYAYRRWSAAVSWPLLGPLAARASAIGGTAFYGVVLTVSK